MLKGIVLRIVFAVISATILSIIGNYLSSRLERVPRLLREGVDQKTKKKKKKKEKDPNRRQKTDTSKGSGKSDRPRTGKKTRRHKQNQARAGLLKCQGSTEKKGQPKSPCRNGGGGARPNANVRDRAFSHGRDK